MPRLHLLPSRISKFSISKPRGGIPPAHAYGARGHVGGMSSLCLLPKILHLLKNFLRTLYTIIEIMDSMIAGSMTDCYSRK
jgi:hypothetical protein